MPGGMCSIFVCTIWWTFALAATINYFAFATVIDSTVLVLSKQHRTSPGYDISVNNVNILHNLQTQDQDIIQEAKDLGIDIRDEIDKYIQTDYVQIDSRIYNKSDPSSHDYEVIQSGKCSELIDTEKIAH